MRTFKVTEVFSIVSAHILVMALTLASTSAFAFIPKQTLVPVDSSDILYVTDNKNQVWKTQTDCTYNITEKSDVSITSFQKRVRENTKLLVSVDNEKQMCKVLNLTQMF